MSSRPPPPSLTARDHSPASRLPVTPNWRHGQCWISCQSLSVASPLRSTCQPSVTDQRLRSQCNESGVGTSIQECHVPALETFHHRQHFPLLSCIIRSSAAVVTAAFQASKYLASTNITVGQSSRCGWTRQHHRRYYRLDTCGQCNQTPLTNAYQEGLIASGLGANNYGDKASLTLFLPLWFVIASGPAPKIESSSSFLDTALGMITINDICDHGTRQ